jgi:hypothetical protein
MMILIAVGVLLSIFRHGVAETRSEDQEFFAQREQVT